MNNFRCAGTCLKEMNRFQKNIRRDNEHIQVSLVHSYVQDGLVFKKCRRSVSAHSVMEFSSCHPPKLHSAPLHPALCIFCSVLRRHQWYSISIEIHFSKSLFSSLSSFIIIYSYLRLCYNIVVVIFFFLSLQRAFCAYCHDRIWGLGRQGFKCIQCKLLVHKKCHKLVQKPCSSEHVEQVRERDVSI